MGLIRSPIRLLPYSDKAMAYPRELLADFDNGILYMIGPDGTEISNKPSKGTLTLKIGTDNIGSFDPTNTDSVISIPEVTSTTSGLITPTILNTINGKAEKIHTNTDGNIIGVGSTTVFGHVKVQAGNGLNIINGIITTAIASDMTTGAMPSSAVNKLAGIAENANNYILPTANVGSIGGVKSGTDITVDADGNVSINDNSHNHTIANITGLQIAINAKLNANLLGVANGIPTTGSDNKILSQFLPSSIDNVDEFGTFSEFPATGVAERIYIDLSTNKTYRWGGSTYVSIGSDLALGFTNSTAYRGDLGASLRTDFDNHALLTATGTVLGHGTGSTAIPLAAGTAFGGTINGVFANANHVHPLQTTVSGSAGSVVNSMIVKLNGGTAEGTNQFTYNGATSKSINITPSLLGAAPASHAHNEYINQNAYGIMKVNGTNISSIGTTDILTFTAGSNITLTADTANRIITIAASSSHPSIGINSDSSSSTSPGFSGSFTAVDSVTRDSYGHVTSLNTKTVSFPAAPATYTHPNSGIGAGTYGQVYVNAQGHVTTAVAITSIAYGGTGSNSAAGARSTLGAASTVTYSATIGTTWSGSVAPFTQNITVSGMTSSDNPIVDIVPSAAYATVKTQIEAYANIYRITTTGNSITVYSNAKTTVTIPIQLKCVR